MKSGTLRWQGPEWQEPLFVMRQMKQRGELVPREVCSIMVKRVVELLFQIGQHGVCVRWAV